MVHAELAVSRCNSYYVSARFLLLDARNRLGDFEKVEPRAGTILRAEEVPGARKPSYKLWIDLGGLGVKTPSAQMTCHWSR